MIRLSQRASEAQSMVTGSRQKDLRIQRVVQALTEDPSRTLPELALSCQVSVSRLIHLFKDEIGINVKSYRLDCRLQAAAMMLISTGIPIKAIAGKAGYHHTSSFMRAFKTHFGVSPTNYRRGQRQRAA
jgi:AraC family transcriptional regulator of arabinose operon